MWILPSNYQLSSHYAADMVGWKEDLTLQALNIESSLMWRSKPSPLQTWLRRWKPGSYLPALYGAILKPCQWNAFETELTSLLAVIRVSPFQQQESDSERMTQDTCGLTSGDTLNQLDLFAASSRMLKDTSVSDSERSLATWKASVTKQRGEYSQRVKSAHLTKEKESTFWPTPTTLDNIQVAGQYKNPRSGTTLGGAVRAWPTPSTRDYKGANGYESTMKKIAEGKRANMGQLPNAVMVAERETWPTPTVQDGNKATKKMRDNHQNNLTAVVFSQEAFPTPTTRDWKGGYNEASLTRSDGKSRRFDALPNAVIGGVGTDIVPGHLNPNWVEWLMGVPTGWTALGCWETE